MPAMLCALTGTILAISLEMMGFLVQPSLMLAQFWEREPFYLVDPYVLRGELNWVGAFLMSWSIAYFTLDCTKSWRRVMVGGMAFISVLAFAPSFMLWGILWLPFVSLIALAWTWGCAFLYASQHTMPADLAASQEALELKVETIPFPVKKKKVK
ncbi:hypothetical protein [Rubritalea tangerina]